MVDTQVRFRAGVVCATVGFWSVAATAQQGGATSAFPNEPPPPAPQGTAPPAGPPPAPAQGYGPGYVQAPPSYAPGGGPPPGPSQPAYPGAAPQSGYPPGAYPPPPPPPPPAPEVPPEERPARRVSITVSPFHLLLPIAEATVEVRVADHLGVAVVGGIGSVRPKTSDTRFAARELGAQVLWYPLRAFDSLELGAELLYIDVSGTDELATTAFGNGTAVGPLIGYKLVTRGGFTFFVSGGASYLAARARARNDTVGYSETASDSRWIPNLNLNLGWSF